MDKGKEMWIEAIEKELAEIDSEIAALRQKREDVLYNDDEYACYLEQYEAIYEDEPLSIRQYYELSNELDQINEEIMAACSEDFEEVWQKHRKRLTCLERLLAA